MNEAERHELFAELISSIEVYPEPQSNGQWLKSIDFRLPIIEEKMEMSLDNLGGVETVMLLSKLSSAKHIDIHLDMKELDVTKAESEKTATYNDIKVYVKEHSGLNVSVLYIAQVKRKHGIIERECYNKPKSKDAKQPQCPPEKEKAIEEALRFFGMIA